MNLHTATTTSFGYRFLRTLLFLLAATLVFTACAGGEKQAGTASNESQESNVSVQTDQEGRHFEISIKTTKEEKDASQDLTPIVGEVTNAPVPFAGSDGKTHLDYELEATNFSGGKTTIEKLE